MSFKEVVYAAYTKRHNEREREREREREKIAVKIAFFKLKTNKHLNNIFWYVKVSIILQYEYYTAILKIRPLNA